MEYLSSHEGVSYLTSSYCVATKWIKKKVLQDMKKWSGWILTNLTSGAGPALTGNDVIGSVYGGHM